MGRIVLIAHIVDHNAAGSRSMHKLIVAKVNAYVGYAGFAATGLEEYEVAFRQFIAANTLALLVLLGGGARQHEAVHEGNKCLRESGTVYTAFITTSIFIAGAVPVVDKAKQLAVVHFFYRHVQQDGIFELHRLAHLYAPGCISGRSGTGRLAVGMVGSTGCAGIAAGGIAGLDSNVLDKAG